MVDLVDGFIIVHEPLSRFVPDLENLELRTIDQSDVLSHCFLQGFYPFFAVYEQVNGLFIW